MSSNETGATVGAANSTLSRATTRTRRGRTPSSSRCALGWDERAVARWPRSIRGRSLGCARSRVHGVGNEAGGSRVRIDVVALTLDAQALRAWPDLADADVDLRSLGAQALWLRGVQ